MPLDKAKQRQQEIETARLNAKKIHPQLWKRMIAQWKQPGRQDFAWLMYSANYLMRTGNVRWAIDPFTLRARLPTAPDVPVERDLSALDFVLLTHRHADHLDLDLIGRLKDYPINWVIPTAIQAEVIRQTGLINQKIITPQSGQRLIVKDISILPFDSLHWEWKPSERNRTPATAIKGIPETGYHVTINGRCWLFPGDIRTYDPSLLPAMGTVDTVFAHLWLGRGEALSDLPPLVESFCNFYKAYKPKRIVVTHLNELGRSVKSFWNAGHYQMVEKAFHSTPTEIQFLPAFLGDEIPI